MTKQTVHLVLSTKMRKNMTKQTVHLVLSPKLRKNLTKQTAHLVLEIAVNKADQKHDAANRSLSSVDCNVLSDTQDHIMETHLTFKIAYQLTQVTKTHVKIWLKFWAHMHERIKVDSP